MVDNMVEEVKEKVTRLIELVELKPSRNTAYESQRQSSYFPTKSTGNGQGGMGEMKIEMIKRNIGILGLVLKMIVMKRVIQRIPMN